MAAWIVSKINPVTHEVTMKHESGVTFDTIIPEEHRATPETKNAYLQSLAAIKPIVVTPDIATKSVAIPVLRQSLFKRIWLKILSIFKRKG